MSRYSATDPADIPDRDIAVEEYAELLMETDGLSREDAYAQADSELRHEPVSRREREDMLRVMFE